MNLNFFYSNILVQLFKLYLVLTVKKSRLNDIIKFLLSYSILAPISEVSILSRSLEHNRDLWKFPFHKLLWRKKFWSPKQLQMMIIYQDVPSRLLWRPQVGRGVRKHVLLECFTRIAIWPFSNNLHGHYITSIYGSFEISWNFAQNCENIFIGHQEGNR